MQESRVQMTTGVTAVLQRRDRLRESFRQLWNCTLDGDNLQTVIPLLQQHLPKVGRDVLFETMRQYVGRELFKAELDQLAWLLAGNLDQLQAGCTVSPWRAQLADEWVPVQVERVFPAKDRYNSRVYCLSLIVLAGTPVGKRFQATRKPTFLTAMSRKLGFTNRGGSLPYLSGLQYMSLRFQIQILAAKSQQELMFHGVDGAPGLTTWNRRILKQRHRLIPCPQGFTHQCHRCVIGSDICPAATHKLTYTQGACENCGQTDAWFDPEITNGFCVECENRNAWII